MENTGLFMTECNENKTSSTANENMYAKLDEVLKQPVLKKALFTEPVIIETCDLPEYNGNYMIRVRPKDGAEGYCVGHTEYLICTSFS